jgi:DNA invertase Pin-like site-specific DNA recombinase
MPTRTIAYLRVSTDKQADRGVSLDAQRAKLKTYAELYELDLVEVIVDAGQSAKSLDRPGLQRALAMLKAGEAEALLVVKLDRLTRSVVDLGTMVERYFAPGKAALLSVGEQIDTRSAAGRLVLNVLASVSQWEREAIGERTATAMQHKAKQGEYTGGWAPLRPPCGRGRIPAGGSARRGGRLDRCLGVFGRARHSSELTGLRTGGNRSIPQLYCKRFHEEGT